MTQTCMYDRNDNELCGQPTVSESKFCQTHLDCEHENLSEDKLTCLDCEMKFVACRGCYVIGTGMPVYHGIPECHISQEDWAAIVKVELDAIGTPSEGVKVKVVKPTHPPSSLYYGETSGIEPMFMADYKRRVLVHDEVVTIPMTFNLNAEPNLNNDVFAGEDREALAKFEEAMGAPQPTMREWFDILDRAKLQPMTPMVSMDFMNDIAEAVKAGAFHRDMMMIPISPDEDLGPSGHCSLYETFATFNSQENKDKIMMLKARLKNEIAQKFEPESLLTTDKTKILMKQLVQSVVSQHAPEVRKLAMDLSAAAEGGNLPLIRQSLELIEEHNRLMKRTLYQMANEAGLQVYSDEEIEKLKQDEERLEKASLERYGSGEVLKTRY